MQIIICENDSLCQESLQEKINQWAETSQHSDISVLCFTSPEELLFQWKKGLRVDLLFLDILFNQKLNSMESTKKIRLIDLNVPIVFITSSNPFVQKEHTVHAFRYLGKPICCEEIAYSLDAAYKQYTTHHEYLIFADNAHRIALRHEDIFYLEARSPYTFVRPRSNQEPMRFRMRFSDLQRKLPAELFVPCHRSYIVNIMHVLRIKQQELQLSSGDILPISRSYIHLVSSAFDSYYQKNGTFIYVNRI